MLCLDRHLSPDENQLSRIFNLSHTEHSLWCLQIANPVFGLHMDSQQFGWPAKAYCETHDYFNKQKKDIQKTLTNKLVLNSCENGRNLSNGTEQYMKSAWIWIQWCILVLFWSRSELLSIPTPPQHFPTTPQQPLHICKLPQETRSSPHMPICTLGGQTTFPFDLIARVCLPSFCWALSGKLLHTA